MIVKNIYRIKLCLKWLKAFKNVMETKNSDVLRGLAENANVPMLIKRRSNIPHLSNDIHDQRNTKKRFGNWIKRYRTMISDNRVHPCFVCQTLQSKETVKYINKINCCFS